MVKRNIFDKTAADDSGLWLTDVHLFHIKGIGLLVSPRFYYYANPHVQRVG